MKTQAPYVLARKSVSSTHFELTDKLLAHTMGWQHYAFSIFIFNSQGELLLQKRAPEKYHSPGLWTNTCCSHPLSSQLPEVQAMASERLKDEMGIVCDLQHIFRFEYRVPCGELIENEIDDVFVGFSDDPPILNTEEVSEYRYVRLEELRQDVEAKPADYTEWLKIILKSHYDTLSRAALNT